MGGPIGPCWAAGSWADTCWLADSWGVGVTTGAILVAAAVAEPGVRVVLSRSG